MKKSIKNNINFEKSLIAPYGMNCILCQVHMREKNPCPGCRGDDNLEKIKQKGIRNFILRERVRSTCPDCGEVICVHKPNCLYCGSKLNENAFE
jgi:hypothetical protein